MNMHDRAIKTLRDLGFRRAPATERRLLTAIDYMSEEGVAWSTACARVCHSSWQAAEYKRMDARLHALARAGIVTEMRNKRGALSYIWNDNEKEE